jgi:hypothetical protein
MILGLGIARLLTSTVTVFRACRRVKIDYLPLVWSTGIFIQQIIFWWSLQELSTLVAKWSLAGFLLLVGMVLALFPRRCLGIAAVGPRRRGKPSNIA